MFIIVDGIDGCGKGTIADALAAARRAEGARVFDLREFTKCEHRLPEIEELADYDVIISAEPTHTWIGSSIREELIRDNGRSYTARATADAYALDRLVLYRRMLLPARAAGKDIIQERSVTSSLIYQPIQREALPIEEVAALEGNAFALAHPPDLCIIVSTDPPRAVQRLQLRKTKQDAAIFEKLPILQALHERYHAPWFRSLLAAHGWHTEFLDANGAVEDAVGKAKQLWNAVKKTPQDQFLISN
ncbi:hypothetical protein HY634_03985 [Candidatus Uhrbacteria bacterium]|nr:hypothetical protein [Candidatus Uhrbacteria bacterium]